MPVVMPTAPLDEAKPDWPPLRYQSSDWARAVVLVFAVLALFGRSVTFDFINYDDFEYVATNPRVYEGATRDNLAWAWKSFKYSNWHPLTWWSWQFDVAIQGHSPQTFHRTNVLLHLINVLLVHRLIWLLSTNGRTAFWLALVFAIHPHRWESVAWISERKDLLSAVFALLTTIQYHLHVCRPGRWTMSFVTGWLALSLCAKAMAVTLPCVFIVLDWFCYRRGKTVRDGLRLVGEKWPLWLLVGVVCVLTFLAQNEGGAVRKLHELSVERRLMGAIWAYLVYVAQTIWPFDLCVFYPIPETRPLWQPAVACVVLGGISIAAYRLRRSHPFLIVGWHCYLGMLVPVIGLVQVGDQAHADRYTYLPSIPLLGAMGVAGAIIFQTDWVTRRRPLHSLEVLTAAGILALAILSYRQGSSWKDSRSVWLRALQVAPCDYAWWNLGTIDLADEKYHDAVTELREAVRLGPVEAVGRGTLAAALDGVGEWEEAERYAQEAIQLSKPDMVNLLGRSHLILSKAAKRRGDLNQEILHLQSAVKYSDNFGLRTDLGLLLYRAGRVPEAIETLQTARDQDPQNYKVRANLANVYSTSGDWSSAAKELATCVEISPEDRTIRSRWVTALLAAGEDATARQQAQLLVRIDPRWPAGAIITASRLVGARSSSTTQIEEGNWLAKAVLLVLDEPPSEVLDVLAMGAAARGQFEEAERLAARAIKLATTAGKTDLAGSIQQRREAYLNHERVYLPEPEASQQIPTQKR